MTNNSSHAGHSARVHGADWNGRREDLMARQLNALFIAKLRSIGHSVEDDTDDSGNTASQIVNNQIRNVNSRHEDLAFAWHLNASDTRGQGVEVLCYSEKERALAQKVVDELAKRTGWKNRGVKIRPDIGVIRSTRCPLLLIEAGFIDNEADMSRWNPDAITSAVIYAVYGKETMSGANSQPVPPSSNSGTVGERGVVRTLSNVNLRSTPSIGDNVLRVLPSGTDWEYFYKVSDGSHWWYNLGGKQFVRDDVVAVV